MRITLPSGTPAEIVRSDGADRGLVVLPDIMGLGTLFDGHVARLAAENGWTVVAVEPFGNKGELGRDERLAAMAELDDEHLLGDVVAAADETGCPTVSIIGFCMGGMFALKAAGTGRFHRAAAFYGMIHVPEAWSGPKTGDPLDMASAPGACPVLAVVGTSDPFTPAAEVDELEAAGATVVRYEGRDHGFVHDPDRPTHDPSDAADAWTRALTFLAD